MRYLFRWDGSIHQDTRRDPGKIGHHGQYLESSTSWKSIWHNIHRPDFIRPLSGLHRYPNQGNPLLLHVTSQWEPLLLIHSLGSLVVDDQAFFFEQGMQSWTAISSVYVSQPFHSFSENVIALAVRFVLAGGSITIYQLTRMPFAQPKAINSLR